VKLPNPYRCNYCLNLKGEANHWYLHFLSSVAGSAFILDWWDDTLAQRDDVEHICSQACASKALSSWMSLVSKKTESDSPCAALELPRGEENAHSPAVRS
jgi:hypothetical protein